MSATKTTQASTEKTTTGGALTIERRKDGVAVLRLDVPGEPVNTLKKDFAPEFRRVCDQLEADATVQAAVLISGKPDGFLAGADITMLEACTTAAAAAQLSREGQQAMDRIANLRIPVVAAIHGACLGGGLELALACRGRVASDDRRTKLGLPEVQLGLLPGAGGTQRLPRLIGVADALDLLLTGKQLDAKRALKAGLVDEVVPQAILLEVACARALRLASAKGERRPSFGARLQSLLSAEGLTELGLEKNPLGRRVLFGKAREALLRKTQGNYPGPEKILDVVRVGLEKGIEAGLAAEAEAFGELVVSPVARQLMNIFFATQALKKDPGVDGKVELRPIGKVGMIGAGLMGSGIAWVTAREAGLPVRLRDKDDASLARGLNKVRGNAIEQSKRKRLTPFEADRVASRVTATTGYDGFGGCDVVIEAVFEDLGVKHKVLADVEASAPKAVFATNTSSIPITKIAAAAKRPEAVLGMHYFSPVEKMPLLEVIVTKQTAPWATAMAVELGKKQGKTVIVVGDGPGFYTTRVLAPYLNEAAWLVAEGAAIDAVDRALVKFGFPVGPIALMDEVGIDVGAKVGKILLEAFGERFAPPAGLEKLEKDGRQGRKNGKGFYRYDVEKGEGKRPVDESVYALLGVKPGKQELDEAAAWRCTLMLVNEAVRCLEEGILRSPRDGDIGAIFGLGFPPFRGGPFRVVDALGAAEVVRRLEALAKAHGPRFEPAARLREMAKTGGTFHPAKGR